MLRAGNTAPPWSSLGIAPAIPETTATIRDPEHGIAADAAYPAQSPEPPVSPHSVNQLVSARQLSSKILECGWNLFPKSCTFRTVRISAFHEEKAVVGKSTRSKFRGCCSANRYCSRGA